VYPLLILSIKAGSRLGPYEIVSNLGAGGMGEVYRARDTRVGRDVALKVLPASFASDEERRQRFEQEALATAALNHPNLLTIHDVGTADGTPYIVTELLEGETLREKLEGGAGLGSPVPLRKAVEWAGAIATGLAAAHDKGVVHRDLKPDNIFVTTDGRVKILDFGLAKLTSSFQSDATDSKTAQRNTSPGAVMGTVGYMSPEQVRGQNLDQRTDIFSLGAILYEMLSGRRAFRGESSADTMSAILREDPPEIAGSGIDISPGLDRIVRRCLEKIPSERFHSAHDLAYALEAITGSSVRSAPNIPVVDRPRRIGAMAPVAGAIVLVAVAFFAGRMSLKSTAPVAAGEAEQPAHLLQLTDLLGRESEPGLSPDGTMFVYSARTEDGDDIFLQRVGGGNPINLTNSPGKDDGFAVFSPNGSQIAFSGGDGIWVMGASGDSLRRLTDAGWHAAWAPDGKSIVIGTKFNQDPRGTSGVGELWRVDVATGERTNIDVGGVDAIHPSCSPDGKWIAFWGLREGTSERVIYVAPAAGGTPNELTHDDFVNWYPVFGPDGHSIYFSSDRGGSMNLWRMPFDPVTGTKAGPPTAVTTSPGWNGRFSIAKTGAIAFTDRSWTWTIERASVDLRKGRMGKPETVTGQTTRLESIKPSSDGKFLTLPVLDPNEDLVVFPVADPSKRVRLTNDKFRDRGPLWMPGDDRILFFSDRSGTYQCWSVRPDGSDLRQETRDGCARSYLSPDGTRVLHSKGGDTWYLTDLSKELENRVAEVLPEIREGVTFTSPYFWSPDGRLIGSDVSGQRSTGVYAYTPAAKTWEKIAAPGDYWYLALGPDDEMIVVTASGEVETINLRTSAVRSLGTIPAEAGDLELSKDGSTLFWVLREEQCDIWLLQPEGK